MCIPQILFFYQYPLMQKLLILYRLVYILIISYSIKVWCDDYDDPEDIF